MGDKIDSASGRNVSVGLLGNQTEATSVMGSMSRLTNHDEKLDENVNFANSNQAIVKRNNKAKVNIDM